MSEELAPLEEASGRDQFGELSLLTQQKYKHREKLFEWAVIFCGVLYALCVVYFLLVVFNENYRMLFIHSKHVAFLGLTLFVVPSLIFGRLIKSVFTDKAEDDIPKTPLQALTKSFDD